MKTIKSSVILFLVMAGFILSSTVFAQDAMTPKAAEKSTPKIIDMNKKDSMMDPEMMAKFQAYSMPNENHKVLDALVGNWSYTLKWWMAPDQAPEESMGASEAGWILNKHFLKQTVNGTSMGQPFEGMGIIGYNNLKNVYESIWLDNMATGMMIGTASFDAVNKMMSESGHFSCPLVNGDRGYRTVTKIQDDDHHSYEMYMTDPKSGQEFKSMEINYTRAK